MQGLATGTSEHIRQGSHGCCGCDALDRMWRRAVIRISTSPGRAGAVIDKTEEFLRAWAAARAGNDPKLAEALQGLITTYSALRDQGATWTVREFLNPLPLPEDGAQRQS